MTIFWGPIDYKILTVKLNRLLNITQIFIHRVNIIKIKKDIIHNMITVF